MINCFEIDESDILILKYQLKRENIRFLSVTKRCKFNNPVVIAQDPFFTRGILFPTIYYLTCPKLNKIISSIEASLFFKNIKKNIELHLNPFYNNFIKVVNVYQNHIINFINKLYLIKNNQLTKNYEIKIIKKSSNDYIYSDIINSETINVSYELYKKLISTGFGGSLDPLKIKCIHAFYSFLIISNDIYKDNKIVLYFKNIIDNEINHKFSNILTKLF